MDVPHCSSKDNQTRPKHWAFASELDKKYNESDAVKRHSPIPQYASTPLNHSGDSAACSDAKRQTCELGFFAPGSSYNREAEPAGDIKTCAAQRLPKCVQRLAIRATRRIA